MVNAKLDPKSAKKLDFALKLKSQGKLREACEIFLSLEKNNPNYPGLFLMLGHIFWKNGEPEKAQEYFQKTVRLGPKSKLASLSLFHVLWNLGKIHEALEEMRRFLLIAECKDYEEILEEILKKDEAKKSESLVRLLGKVEK